MSIQTLCVQCWRKFGWKILMCWQARRGCLHHSPVAERWRQIYARCTIFGGLYEVDKPGALLRSIEAKVTPWLYNHTKLATAKSKHRTYFDTFWTDRHVGTVLKSSSFSSIYIGFNKAMQLRANSPIPPEGRFHFRCRIPPLILGIEVYLNHASIWKDSWSPLFSKSS